MDTPEYGIGRLPRDVDSSDEARAEIEAQQIQQRSTQPAPVGFAPTGTTNAGAGPDDTAPCEACGREGWWNPGAGQTLCERHWDEY